MTRRSVARTYPEIILQAQNILAALRAYEDELGIHYNTASSLEVELAAALGDPASATEGAQAELNERRVALSAARESRDETLAAARAFCANAIDTLKPRLGRRWNAKWLAVGFTRSSLSIPREPSMLLCDLRAYYLSHPGHESAELGLTAVRADELMATLNAARSAVSRGRAQRNEARTMRDEAIERVRRRLAALHSELRQILPSDDHRWRIFGFRRPIDKGQPDAVEGLSVRAGSTPGEVLVTWAPACRATSYRVTKQVVGTDMEPVEVGILHDLLALISGLPADAVVIIAVHARNRSGEAQAAEWRLEPGRADQDVVQLPS